MKLMLAILLLAAGSLFAHHSYGAFDRDHPAIIEGTIERLLFVNPHVTLTIKTADSTLYTAEWNAVFQLGRTGVTAGTLKEGDHVIITGSPKKDPAEHFLSILTAIRRPADGWSWTSRPK